MGMERWWNDTDRGKLNCWERNLLECHFVYHKLHKNSPEIELGPPLRESCDLKTAINLNFI